MLLFGHVGNTVGLAKLCQVLIRVKKPAQTDFKQKSEVGENRRLHPPFDRIRGRIGFIDYRMVIVGSMLPDIIDKPLWLLGGGSLGWAGRGYAHAFLFSFVLFVFGLLIAARRHKRWLLTIAAGSFAHLIFDQLWRSPVTLWWPLLGPIRPGETTGWFPDLWTGLLSNPYVYISETSGLLITLYVALRLLLGKRVKKFLIAGDIDWKGVPASRK